MDGGRERVVVGSATEEFGALVRGSLLLLEEPTGTQRFIITYFIFLFKYIKIGQK